MDNKEIKEIVNKLNKEADEKGVPKGHPRLNFIIHNLKVLYNINISSEEMSKALGAEMYLRGVDNNGYMVYSQ